ncbi:Cell division control protein 4 [Podosphaera aphanis]|nr:Cell division control protein 4 [Podosphaera aphanis]
MQILAPQTSASSTDPSVKHLTSNLKHSHTESNSNPSSPSSQTVSVGWIEDEDPESRQSSRVQIELAECVETKTVTTTTTTKRSYPPLLVRQPALGKLDKKEYPLATKLPPPSLLNFSYDVVPANKSPQEQNTSKSNLTLQSCSEYVGISHKNKAPEGPERHDSHPHKAHPQHKSKESFSHRIGKVKNKLVSITHRASSKSLEQKFSSVSKSMSGKKESSPEGANQKLPNDSEFDSGRKLRRRDRGIGMRFRANRPFPATPDTSDMKLSIPDAFELARHFEKKANTCSDLSRNDSFEAPSPQSSSNRDTFLNTVATPPIAESDLEPLDAVDSEFTQNLEHSASNTRAARNSSLPSPGLSPVLTPNDPDFYDEDERPFISSEAQNLDDPVTERNEDLSGLNTSLDANTLKSQDSCPSVLDMKSMIDVFDTMPEDMKTLMMFQLLRRCPRRALQTIADVINPALKCDFIVQLPLELSLHILSFLNHRDLCRAAQVSKQWRNIVDSNETGWKEIFDKDGFFLPRGELQKAISQGWGWQDPFGSDGFEEDLSNRSNSVLPVGSLGSQACESSPPIASLRKGRGTTKRKRGAVGTDRAKRRATSHEFAQKSQGILAKYPYTAEFCKSEGPLTAANAAILAVPDPGLGLPGLRKLHLFKSLYRRHYLLQKSWMNGKVAPHHFAFPAHPAHVITCLQFDDDKIITGSDDTLINMYDTKTGTLRKKLEGHEGGVWALQYEGNILVSGSTDRSVRVWDIEKGICTQVFHGHTSTVRCLQILMPQVSGTIVKGNPVMIPEKPLIITGSRDSQLRVWKLPEPGSKHYFQSSPLAIDTDCPYFVRVLTGHAHSVRAISAHQDTLVSGSYDNTVRVWKISTGETIHKLVGHTMKVYSVVLDHKRARCISGSMDNLVKIWSIETGTCLFTLEGHSSLVGLLDLSGERLVSAAADSTLRIWDPENGMCKSTLSAHTGAITCFQHDNQKVISGSDRTLKLWNIKTGECVKDLLVDLSGVWQVKFDERRCVAAVQRDNLTYVEVLDFGASRDGIPANQRGTRRLLSDPPVATNGSDLA